MRREDDLELLFGILVLLAILLFLGLVWFLIASCIAAWRYRQYLKKAEADFEQIARENGLNIPGSELIETVHGIGIHAPHDAHQTVGEWAAGTLFGAEEYVA